MCKESALTKSWNAMIIFKQGSGKIKEIRQRIGLVPAHQSCTCAALSACLDQHKEAIQDWT